MRTKTNYNAKIGMLPVVILSVNLVASSAHAQEPEVTIFEQGGKRCISSNGMPNHPMGQFPNRSNPHSFRTQNLKFCFDRDPVKGSKATQGTPLVGIALNGILMRPGTADWYDPSSPRGFSRDRSSGWNLEGMGSARALGIDKYNAHVDERGIYHYHGVPVGLLDKVNSSHIGYAADGFEIHYAGSNAVSSYRLKPGNRPSAPGGKHDGKYIQDWEFKKGSGNLDKCNGAIMSGKYVYFATDTFPFYPRCHWVMSVPTSSGPEVGETRMAGQVEGPVLQRQPKSWVCRNTHLHRLSGHRHRISSGLQKFWAFRNRVFCRF